MLINKLNFIDSDFSASLDALLHYEASVSDEVEATVKTIIADVREHGDAKVIEFTNTFDQRNVTSMEELVIQKPELKQALKRISSEQKDALEKAATRITGYHQKQVQNSWQYTDDTGTVLGQKITPLDRAGLYAPGGKAAYPSSILMEAIPAKVAGVKDIVLVSPAPQGEVADIVMAAAAIAGVDRLITIGGAQAIAAMAYGTQSIPKVDKIVGPGNIFVATAKRQVFGVVDIDMFAGPSEILVVCDGKTDPDWIAMDLFSQAEHEEQAQAILISTDKVFLEKVYLSIEKLLPTLERQKIASVSLRDRGALIGVDSMSEAVELINRIAPEHLELSVDHPESYLDDIRHAGAIFMGRYTSEALGDYCAGPNHVLPTSGTARFSSPLGVYDFVKRSSIIHCTPQSASELGKIASVLARGESFEAHARSAELRIKSAE